MKVKFQIIKLSAFRSESLVALAAALVLGSIHTRVRGES